MDYEDPAKIIKLLQEEREEYATKTIRKKKTRK